MSNTTQKKSWGDAFQAFLDRRALIMFFLGLSAGIPLLLIFSTLSLWLGEAGIEKSAVTFFSWAALGYSFKFIWAPLIDELPVPYLTKTLGRRRAWLLIAQLLIILAICLMAMTDPALGKMQQNFMAWAAVLLGFSAATQDIVIDAYRIELAGSDEMQSVLASTYNAGYRIGMIITGAGALFLAAAWGTAKGNYIYSAWQYTYFVMAGFMLIGVITTLMIPEAHREIKARPYQRTDYLRLVFVFLLAIIGFILSYRYSSVPIQALTQQFEIKDSLTLFLFEAIRFLSSGIIAVAVAYGLVQVGAVNRQMAHETWVSPIADFFKRYGLKVALVMLLLIGFYRISDIIAGAISNVFYQDLNFTKEQIATAVKTFGVIFSLVGGFLGGLLAQRFNVMRLLLIGAILASSTNLIFIGLVKSGKPLDDIQLNVAGQTFITKADDAGYWSVKIPSSILVQDTQLTVHTRYAHVEPHQVVQTHLPYLQKNQQNNIHFLPLSHDNQLSLSEQQQKIVVSGQFFAVAANQLKKEQGIVILVDEHRFPAKLDEKGLFTASIDGQILANAKQPQLTVVVTAENGLTWTASQQYSLDTTNTTETPTLSIDVQPLGLIDTQQHSDIEVKGKVIQSYSIWWLYFAIIIDNLASGLAGAAFVAFLSSLTSVSFTAVQYALFSSLMTLTPKILGGYSGTMVTHMGYPNFFLMTALIGIPIFLLVIWVTKLLKEHQNSSNQSK